MIGAEDGYNIKMDGNEIIASNNGATSNLHLQTDGGSVYIGNNTGTVFKFQNDTGYMHLPKYKFPNGYNMVGVRNPVTTNDSHLIQNVVATISLSNAYSGYKDISFPTGFDGSPIWILSTSVNSSSYGFLSSIYSPTSTGCRVYIRNIDKDLSTVSIDVQIVACGIKKS
jgi:hypothetical protein